MILLTTNTDVLNQISSLVSVAYDTINLPHTTISQNVFLGDANLYIQRLIPNWEDLIDDDRTLLEIITMKQTAVNILTAFSRVKREQAEDITTDNDQLTPMQAIARYEDDISEGIKILNPDSLNTGGRYIVAAVVVSQ